MVLFRLVYVNGWTGPARGNRAEIRDLKDDIVGKPATPATMLIANNLRCNLLLLPLKCLPDNRVTDVATFGSAISDVRLSALDSGGIGELSDVFDYRIMVACNPAAMAGQRPDPSQHGAKPPC